MRSGFIGCQLSRTLGLQEEEETNQDHQAPGRNSLQRRQVVPIVDLHRDVRQVEAVSVGDRMMNDKHTSAITHTRYSVTKTKRKVRLG